MELKSIELGAPFGALELGYVEWGPPDSDRVALCVHGLTRNARDFDALADGLAGRGYRVLAVDVAGRGRSGWLDDPKDYEAAVYANHLTRFIDLLALRDVDWIGTSMGGIVGMIVAAAERPDGTPAIRRLVLNDIGPLVPHAALAQIGTYLGLDLVFADIDELEQHLRLIHAGFGPLTDDQWRHLARHSAREAPAGIRLHYDPDIRVPFAAVASEDIEMWDIWDRIDVPVLVIHGTESPILLNETAGEMRIRGPRAAVVHLEGIGHAPALMDDGQIALIADWLDR